MSTERITAGYSDLPVREFLTELASGAPVPGGGAGAALAAAAGTALVSMVCNMTIGREKYQAVESEMREAESRLADLRGRLLDLLEADTRVYSQVMAAYKLPRATADEKAVRTAEIQTSLKAACEVPQEMARVCRDVLAVAPAVAANGNVAAASDAGVGAELTRAGLESAALNVQINLGSIKDTAFVSARGAELSALRAEGTALRDEVRRIVGGKIGG
jgi:methenyltetrahydrofolate cyclohydrolase